MPLLQSLPLRLLLAAWLAGLLAACASAPGGYAQRPDTAASPAFEAAAPAPTALADGFALAKRARTAAEKPASPSAAPAASPARKVHYQGEIRLRATQPHQVLTQAVELVRAEGGYVESLEGERAVLQIPAARFRALYERILGLGEVLHKSLSARDVTDEYLDVELRLNQARLMRDRLAALLQKTSDRKEKLRLMRELERLSAEIELQELSMTRLRTLVDYSRLTLQVEGRPAFDGRSEHELRGFGWIDTLATERWSQQDAAERLALAVPAGMVELDGTRWSAASADGVALGAQRRRNEPRGTTAFWADAIRWRLQQRFDQVEPITAGDFTVLRLLSREEPRFVYWVAVAAKSDQLQVAQAYFPSPAHEQRYRAQLLASLSGGAK